MSPNSDATSRAGSLFVALLAMAAPRTLSQIRAMNVPAGDTSWWLPRRLDQALRNLGVETAVLQEAPHQM